MHYVAADIFISSPINNIGISKAEIREKLSSKINSLERDMNVLQKKVNLTTLNSAIPDAALANNRRILSEISVEKKHLERNLNLLSQ